MTRGYVVIIDNAKEHNIIKCAYQNSDSYFSGLGLEVLKAYKERRMSEFIDEKAKEYEDYKDDYKDIDWSWIDCKVGGPDEFYNDYAYVYDNSKDAISVYYYGEYGFKFSRENIDVMNFVFDNDGDIYRKMAFDMKKRDYENDTHAHVRRIIKNKMTVADIQTAIDTPINSMYMQMGRISTHFGMPNDEFYKRVVDVDSNKEFKFLVKKSSFYGEKCDVYLDTILGRIPVKDGATDFKSAERIIKRFIKENYDEVMNMSRMLDFIDEYQKTLNCYVFIKANYDKVDKSSTEELEKIINKIKDYKSSNLIFARTNSAFNEKSFRYELEKRRKKMLKSEDEKTS